MNSATHEQLTRLALDLLAQGDWAPEAGQLQLIKSDEFRNGVLQGAEEADYMTDVCLVDVDYGLDDPHADNGFWTNDDHSHYSSVGRFATSLNHMIDIRKGPGVFDDFDGYSYWRGSASTEQYQDAAEVMDLSGVEIAWLWSHGWSKVDAALNMDYARALGDEYVHAPGQQWYDFPNGW